MIVSIHFKHFLIQRQKNWDFSISAASIAGYWGQIPFESAFCSFIWRFQIGHKPYYLRCQEKIEETGEKLERSSWVTCDIFNLITSFLSPR